MGDLLPFPASERPTTIPTPTDALVFVDSQLALAEEALVRARWWLKHGRGNAAGKRALRREIAELERNIVRLERERLRIAGPELALVKGRLDG